MLFPTLLSCSVLLFECCRVLFEGSQSKRKINGSLHRVASHLIYRMASNLRSLVMICYARRSACAML